MSEAVQVALIVATPPTLVALAGLITSWKNRTKINTMNLNINGRLQQLVNAKHSDGIEEGRHLQATDRESGIQEGRRQARSERD